MKSSRVKLKLPVQAAAKELRTHTGMGDSDEEADDRFGGEVRRSAPQVSVVENVSLVLVLRPPLLLTLSVETLRTQECSM